MKIQSGLTTEWPVQSRFYSFGKFKFSIKRRTLVYFIVGILYFICFLFSLLLFTKSTDETVYHYPNILNFYNNGLSAVFNDQYSSANTPLPYIIIALIAKVFSPGIILARIITCIISFFSFLLAARLLRRSGASQYSVFIILFFPYFFINSFIFYVINYALLFLLIGLNILKDRYDSESLLINLTAGTFFSLAVLCQQFYLVVPIALIMVRLFYTYKKNENIYSIFKARNFINNLVLVIPLLIPCYIFYRWDGLTHPNFHKHSLSFYPSTIVAVLFVLGFYYLPFIIQSFKKIKIRESLITLGIAVVLTYFFKPIFTNTQGPGLFTGIILHVLELSGKVIPVLPFFGMSFLTWMGLTFLLLVIRHLKTPFEFILFISSILLAIIYSLNTLIGERHFIGLNILLFLLILPWMRKSFIIPYSIVISVVGICYFLFFFFFKFN